MLVNLLLNLFLVLYRNNSLIETVKVITFVSLTRILLVPFVSG